MANCKRELKYRCWNDCAISGCPGHEATLIFQSCSNSFYFNIGGKEVYLDPNEFQAMIDLTKSLDRCDTGVDFNKE
jgi:hypothetical protein